MLNHGGQLQHAKIQYPLVSKPWLDLSTGIAPWTWPVPQIPVEVWQRLPEDSPELQRAAQIFYRSPDAEVLAVSGSQAAIEKIPTIISRGAVALPLWGYAEHQKAWQKAGHHLHFYRNREELSTWIESGKVQHVVIINPNNPTAEWLESSQIERWQLQLSTHNGYLLVDEAFADALAPSDKTAAMLINRRASNLIVLRSVGKFFGLAGLRLGFVLGSPAILEQLRAQLALWSVSHPAQWLGLRLLNDECWHQQQRQRIEDANAKLLKLLRECLPSSMADELKSSSLFVSLFGHREVLKNIHEMLAQQGIWVRFFEPQQARAGLRFGLTDDDGLARLRVALTSESCRFF